VEDLHREDPAARRDPERAALRAGGGDHARARRSVDVVARHLVEGIPEQLRPGIEMPGMVVVGDEEIASVEIQPLRRIGPTLDVRLQVR
jgi:hypothetical protein